MFIGRKNELSQMNRLYNQEKFQLFILYGRRRVGKTTLLKEFCKNKSSIFFSAEQGNEKMNLEKFSQLIFQYYGEDNIEPFLSWEKALLYINDRQKNKPLVLVLDEFPYLVYANSSLLSILQHLIDHILADGKLFLILCGSYMGFMEKEVLGAKSPLFGRRTSQLYLKPFNYLTSIKFLNGFGSEEKLMLYGAFGGTAMYLSQINNNLSLKDNIEDIFLNPIGYLYEEPIFLLKQELNEPGVYYTIIDAIAKGAVKANEIAAKTGEDTAKCLKYIKTLCELGILYKENPFGEKPASRKSIYGISDFMFRFWFRYISGNKTLLETNAKEAVWKLKIEPDYSNYMGLVFEQVCKEYLLFKNSKGELPFLFTEIGRWWGTNQKEHCQEEIDIAASDKSSYLICECKWKNQPTDYKVLESLRKKASLVNKNSSGTWYMLFSKSGFTESLIKEAKKDSHVILAGIKELIG